VGLLPAAAMLIGSKSGSNHQPQYFQSWHGQPVAKTYCGSHVFFNLLDPIVSLLLLVTNELRLIHWFQQLLLDDVQFHYNLGYFHTCFNLLGGRTLSGSLPIHCEKWLKTKFSTGDEKYAKKTKYLDKTPH